MKAIELKWTSTKLAGVCSVGRIDLIDLNLHLFFLEELGIKMNGWLL